MKRNHLTQLAALLMAGAMIDLERLIIIKSLRCANYSLSAILRMLSALSLNPEASIRDAIDTPRPDDDILTACDHLLTSLEQARDNAEQIDLCRHAVHHDGAGAFHVFLYEVPVSD